MRARAMFTLYVAGIVAGGLYFIVIGLLQR